MPDDTEIKDYLNNSIVTPEAMAELMGYANEAYDRISYTLGLIPEAGGSLLEIGANPYFLTLLIKRYRDYDIRMINFFGESNCTGEQHIWNEKYGEHHVFRYECVNVEKDALPYPDESFDVVLFCEVLEHLLENPVLALYRISRVLKPGGTLILSTPNVYRVENAKKFLARKTSIYDAYSGYGAYGRHNREYTLYEVEDMLVNAGFEISHKKTLHCGRKGLYSDIVEAAGMGRYIIIKAIKKGSFSWYYPDYLYRGDPVKVIEDKRVIMGKNCHVQSDGWNALETWDGVGHVRWSKKHSVVYLKPVKQDNVLSAVLSAAHDDTPVTITVMYDDKELYVFEATLCAGWQEIEADISLPSLDIVNVCISADKPWIPLEEGAGGDVRERGVACREIGFL